MIYGAWFDFIMKIVFMKKEVLEVVNLRPESSSVRLRLRSLCFTERLESQPPPPHGQRGPASRTAASIVLGGRGDGRAPADHSSSSQLGGSEVPRSRRGNAGFALGPCGLCCSLRGL